MINSITPKHDLSWFIKWAGTIAYIAAAICAAGAWLPWNYIMSLTGASLYGLLSASCGMIDL